MAFFIGETSALDNPVVMHLQAWKTIFTGQIDVGHRDSERRLRSAELILLLVKPSLPPTLSLHFRTRFESGRGCWCKSLEKGGLEKDDKLIQETT